MRGDELAALLRIKRAREARAGVVLMQARAAELQASERRQRAASAADAHAAARPDREAAIYAGLLAGPVLTTKVQAAVIRLARIGAESASLRKLRAHTERDAAMRTTAATSARMAQNKAAREAEAADLLLLQIGAAAAAAAELQLDDEMDDLASLSTRGTWR